MVSLKIFNLKIISIKQYSELSLRQTPLGMTPSVHLRQVSVLKRVAASVKKMTEEYEK